MKMMGIVAVVALLAGPAWAQNTQKYGDPDKVKTQADIAAEKEAERAYKRSLSNIPEQKSTSDPWGAVRSDNAAPKAAAKAPAKPKAAKTDVKTDAAATQ
jgi:hypothetical protein